MSLNNHALGLLAEEKIRRFRLETEGDRRAKEAVNTRRAGRIGGAMRVSVGPGATGPWMIAGRALLRFVSLIRREAARVRSAAWED